MSVEQFLTWDPGDGRRWQLVDGTPRQLPHTNNGHGLLLTEVAASITNHLDAQDSPCVPLLGAGIIPRLAARWNFRIADFAVAATRVEHEEYAITDPMLLLDVVSTHDRAETLANVWAYATLPSVREIVLLWTPHIAADILRRQPGGTWPQDPQHVTDGDLVLDSIGLRTPLESLYPRPRRPTSA